MVAKRREEDAHLRALSQAWHTAAFVALAKVGKLPPLTAVLRRPRRVWMTAAEQHRQLLTLSKIVGTPIREASPQTMAALKRIEGVPHGG